MQVNRLNDYLFKNIFGNPERKEILLSFLNSVLSDGDETDVITEVELADREVDPKYIADKLYRVDIRAKTSDGTIVDIEVQTSDEKNIDKRSLCYWGRLYGNQLEEGQNYSQLRPTIMINVLGFSYFEGPEYHNKYRIMNCRTGKPLNDDLQIHFIEVPKWDSLSRKSRNQLERWLVYISNKNPDELEEIAMTDAAVRTAIKAEEKFLSDKDSRYYYEMREKAYYDHKSAMYSARQEGIEMGMKQERRRIVRNLLQNGFSPEFVKKAMELSDEDLKKYLS